MILSDHGSRLCDDSMGFKDEEHISHRAARLVRDGTRKTRVPLLELQSS